jgi:hypothetical protein
MLIKSKTKVEQLTQRVENLYDQRQAEEDRHAKQQSTLKTIREAQKWVKTDFYCHKHGDTTGIAVKVVQGSGDNMVAFYQSIGSNICREDMTCCKGLRRRITDKQFDPYFTCSEMIKRQQREAKDKGWLLQPGDYGFKTKYGDPSKKKWQQQDKEERLAYGRNNKSSWLVN